MLSQLRTWLAVRRLRRSPEYLEAARLFGLRMRHSRSPHSAATWVKGVLMQRHLVPEPLASLIAAETGVVPHLGD